jgi:hypothetical protein
VGVAADLEEISQPDLLIKSLVPSSGPSKLILTEMGTFLHASEGDMLYESTNPKIPYFNAPIYLENKVSIACPFVPFTPANDSHC